MRQLTFQDIVDMSPCKEHSPDKYIPKTWKGTILDVLKLPNVAPSERLWVAYKAVDDETLRLFTVACARRALGKITKPDPRSIRAVEVAEAFAHGRATAEELQVAHRDATAAYVDATDIAAATTSDAAYVDATNAANAAAAAAGAARLTANATAAYAYANATAAYAYANATAADAANAAATYATAAAATAAREKERAQQIETLIELIKGGSV